MAKRACKFVDFFNLKLALQQSPLKVLSDKDVFYSSAAGFGLFFFFLLKLSINSNSLTYASLIYFYIYYSILAFTNHFIQCFLSLLSNYSHNEFII